jgi:hypothetical protein
VFSPAEPGPDLFWPHALPSQLRRVLLIGGQRALITGVASQPEITIGQITREPLLIMRKYGEYEERGMESVRAVGMFAFHLKSPSTLL